MAPVLRRSGQSTPQEAQHLVVLVHGLWGNPKHMNYIAESLRDRFADDIHLLVCQRNPGSLTYDGIDTWSDRLVREIEHTLGELGREGRNIKRFSMVGYSLGGVVARYIVGLLYHRGIFRTVQPVNFVTLATPHLGVRTPVTGWRNQVWNILGARTLSASGRQLFLVDNFRETGRPILSVMADPDSIFIHGLACFEHRSLYMNVVNDRTVPYYTAGITKRDPYVDLTRIKLNDLPGYNSVILDPERPYDLILQTELSTFSERLYANSKIWVRRVPILAALCVLLPIAVTAFLVNSGYQTLRSRRRLQLHEGDQGQEEYGPYRVPLMVQDMRVGLENAFENVNAAQRQEYLSEDAEDLAEELPEGTSTDVSARDTDPLLLEKSFSRLSRSESHGSRPFPTLALTDGQFEMIKALDNVGFRKWPVHIHNSTHSHAAIIVRWQKKAFEEGKTVIRHMLDNFFV